MTDIFGAMRGRKCGLTTGGSGVVRSSALVRAVGAFFIPRTPPGVADGADVAGGEAGVFEARVVCCGFSLNRRWCHLYKVSPRSPGRHSFRASPARPRRSTREMAFVTNPVGMGMRALGGVSPLPCRATAARASASARATTSSRIDVRANRRFSARGDAATRARALPPASGGEDSSGGFDVMSAARRTK